MICFELDRPHVCDGQALHGSVGPAGVRTFWSQYLWDAVGSALLSGHTRVWFEWYGTVEYSQGTLGATRYSRRHSWAVFRTVTCFGVYSGRVRQCSSVPRSIGCA
jgi:hypothetical protein